MHHYFFWITEYFSGLSVVSYCSSVLHRAFDSTSLPTRQPCDSFVLTIKLSAIPPFSHLQLLPLSYVWRPSQAKPECLLLKLLLTNPILSYTFFHTIKTLIHRSNCKSIQQRACHASLAKTNGGYAVIARSVATKQSQ
jgi:hypothetical protein